MTNFTPSPDNYTPQNIFVAASHSAQLDKFFDKLVNTLWDDWGRIMEEVYADEIADPDAYALNFVEFDDFEECIVSHYATVFGDDAYINLQIIDANGGFQVLTKRIDADLLELFRSKVKWEKEN
jgi:hypothetical protein